MRRVYVCVCVCVLIYDCVSLSVFDHPGTASVVSPVGILDLRGLRQLSAQWGSLTFGGCVSCQPSGSP